MGLCRSDRGQEAGCRSRQLGCGQSSRTRPRKDLVRPRRSLLSTRRRCAARLGLERSVVGAMAVELRSGKVVALTARAAAALGEQAEKYRVPLRITHHLRLSPVFQSARARIQGGELFVGRLLGELGVGPEALERTPFRRIGGHGTFHDIATREVGRNREDGGTDSHGENGATEGW